MRTSLHLKQTRGLGSRHSANCARLKSAQGSGPRRVLLFALGTIAGCSLVVAQISFTRILEGEIAEDTGPSIGCAWGDYDNDGSTGTTATAP
jgi:hypothetical protein